MANSFEITYQKLVELQNQTFEAIKNLDNESLNKKLIAGKWSIIQIMEHVRVSEKQIYNAIQKYIAVNQKFIKPTIINYLRFYIVIAIFKLRIPLKAPTFVSKLSDEIDIVVQREKWLETRNNWFDFLHNLKPEMENKILMIHPLVGPMSITICTKFMLEHYKVHQRQIKRLLGML
ncbi:MAG: DinB family protein [Bacteroidota bacterium]|nr:DinB family protein [Bacteroidota bacterium]